MNVGKNVGWGRASNCANCEVRELRVETRCARCDGREVPVPQEASSRARGGGETSDGLDLVDDKDADHEGLAPAKGEREMRAIR